MREQFLGPIHSGQYFLLSLENQLATVLAVGQAANQTNYILPVGYRACHRHGLLYPKQLYGVVQVRGWLDAQQGHHYPC